MRTKPLQIWMALLACIPVIIGVLTLMGLQDPLYASAQLPAVPVLDSNLRFFGGIWLAMGVAMWCIVPRIAQHTPVFRLIWGAIFLGGIGRLLSMGLSGLPPLPFVGFTILEIAGAPLFLWWQHQMVKAQGGKTGAATA